MAERKGSSSNPRAVGVATAIAATALGLAYMAAAGAPTFYLAINALALVLGLAAFAVIRPPSGASRVAGAVILAFGVLLLATALFGVRVEGAARWVRVAGFSVQISLILVPAMLVAFTQRRDLLSTLGMILAAVGLALQPDRAMAGTLAVALAVLAAHRRDRWVLSALGVAAAGFVATLARPDSLPAVPYVDQILYTSFTVHPLAGVAVVGGALLLIAPAFAGLRADSENLEAYAVFGAAWLSMVVAAALGNYPTPLVGYGASAVLGYALSLAFMPGKARSTAGAADRVRDADPAEGPWGSDLRIGIASA